MYNERRKRFIDYLTDNENTENKASFYFKWIEEFEKEIGIQLENMSKSELIDLFHTLESKGTIRDRYSFVKRYLDWCKVLGYVKINQLASIKTKDLIDTCKNLENITKFYMNEEEVVRCEYKISQGDNAEYDGAIFRAVYEGILGRNCENLAYLTLGDIDTENHTLKLHDGTIKKVSSKLIKMLLDASNVETIHNEVRNTYLEETLVMNPVWKSPKLKNPTDTALKKKFRDAVQKRIRVVADNEHITLQMIYNSGLIHHVKNRAQENGFNFAADMKIKNDKNAIKIAMYNQFIAEFGESKSFSVFKFDFASYVA